MQKRNATVAVVGAGDSIGAGKFAAESFGEKQSLFLVMAGQKRDARLKPKCPGHPRLHGTHPKKDVDARAKPGHDDGE